MLTNMWKRGCENKFKQKEQVFDRQGSQRRPVELLFLLLSLMNFENLISPIRFPLVGPKGVLSSWDGWLL